MVSCRVAKAYSARNASIRSTQLSFGRLLFEAVEQLEVLVLLHVFDVRREDPDQLFLLRCRHEHGQKWGYDRDAL